MRKPVSFKERDLVRAIKAAVKGGLQIERIWVERDGRIVLGFAKPDGESNPTRDTKGEITL